MTGNFSRVMLKVLEPSRLHLIDISFERLNPRDHRSKRDQAPWR